MRPAACRLQLASDKRVTVLVKNQGKNRIITARLSLLLSVTHTHKAGRMDSAAGLGRCNYSGYIKVSYSKLQFGKAGNLSMLR